jgi:hypothetical protein
VQNPENADFLVHLVDDDKWQRREHELASAVDPSRTAAIRKAMGEVTPSTMLSATRRAMSGLVSAI